MMPHEKKAIADFFDQRTVDLFLGKRPSKSDKKNKMKALYLVATRKELRGDPPGSWLMEMDRKFRAGLP